ncbi:MAG TPA: sigma-54 dependent transcriptional regulator [Rhodocyclaceae bacterium]|nr:sigma-54 dependent transcriptional regulator [Rhodocyclaceae bacterium]
MPPALLIVDRDQALTREVCRFFKHLRWDALACTSAEEALHRLDSAHPDVVLAEDTLPGMHAGELFGHLRQIDRQIKLIVMSADRHARTAVSAFKAGASDYVTKPMSLPDLQHSIEALFGSKLDPAAPRLARKPSPADEAIDAIVGNSPVMLKLKSTLRHLMAAARQVVDGDFPAVLVHGETGTGKELVARALHGAGRNRVGPLVEINCASIPPRLLEAELFGYQKGAFTDAGTAKAGLVEEADGGTLFLDEIGEIDFSIQAKLLKLLEDKSCRRLGATSERQLDLRIVSATNRDLEQMVRAGKFRSDLYFRLHVVTIEVPPLRVRDRDILLLARHFLAMHGQRYGRPGLEFAADAEQALAQYTWPGNVRELRNVIEQAVVMTPGEFITARQLTMCPDLHPDDKPKTSHPPQTPAFANFPQRGLQLNDEQLRTMLDALAQTNWNVAKAARLLGLTSDKMRYRIDRLGLSPGGPAASRA